MFYALGQVAKYIWASRGLKSMTIRLFVQPFGQADIKDNVYVQHQWSFVSRIYSTVPSQRVSIGVTSNKRHVKSPATRLFVQQFIQAYNKGQIKALHFWFIVRRIRWQIDSLGKSRQFKKCFPAYLQYVNNDSINHIGIYLTHLRIESFWYRFCE